MTATAHALVGAVIAAKVGNPALAIPIALASHVVMDAIPHWDTGTHSKEKNKNKVLIDSAIDATVGFALSFLLIYFLFPQTSYLYAFFIIIVAQLFDWLMAPYYFFGAKAFKTFYKFQKLYDHKLDKPWGIITQVVFVTTTILLAKII